jgi:hypothetical protein
VGIESGEVSGEGGESELQLASVGDALIPEVGRRGSEEPERGVLCACGADVDFVFGPQHVLVDSLAAAVGLVLSWRGERLVADNGPALVTQQEIAAHKSARWWHESNRCGEGGHFAVRDSISEGPPLLVAGYVSGWSLVVDSALGAGDHSWNRGNDFAILGFVAVGAEDLRELVQRA